VKVEGKGREKAKEEAREKVKKEKVEEVEREKVKVRRRAKKRAMKRRVAMIFGAFQPTLALGRQTSNCHAGQDWCGRFTSDFSWLLSLGKAGCSLAFSGRPFSEHWTGS